MAKNLLRSVLQAHGRTPGAINTSDLVAKIESGYLADSKNGFKQKKTFSPSSLVYGSGRCPRYWVLAFRGGDFHEDITPAQMANMRNGSLAHERIQKAITDAGIMLSQEKKMICNDPPILGYRDAALLWNDAPLPIEIKTTNDMSFTARKDRKNAMPYHIEQLLIYMRLDEHEMGAIVYENKNNHELLVIPVEMNDDYNAWLDKTFEWMRQVRKAYDDGLLPKKNYRSNSKVCKSCPLYNECHKLPLEGDIEIPSLEPLA